MGNLCNIETLDLSRNRLVSASGLTVLSAIFHAESFSLKEIRLYSMNIGDYVAEVLAEGLRRNKSLKQMLIGHTGVLVK